MMTAHDPHLIKAAAQVGDAHKQDGPHLAKPEIEWAIALAAWDSAKAACDIHHENIYRPLVEEFERTFPLPSQHFEVTAQSGQTARYFVPANDLHLWDNHMSYVFREKAATVRTAWLAWLETREQTGYEAVSNESERLCDLQGDREDDLILMPAPHTSALLWKLEQFFGPEARKDDESGPSYCAKWINSMMSDARRLLPDDKR